MNISGKKFSLYVSNNEVCVTASDGVSKGGKRGKIKGMSRGSKSRLLKFLNSAVFDGFDFVTLTYRYNMQNWTRAYADLRSWHKSMSRKFGLKCAVWRQELQERGAIHFHVFCLGYVPVWPKEAIADEWLHCTAQEGDIASRLYGTHVYTVETLDNGQAGVICAYIAKYVAKEGADTVGRSWGILGRRGATETGQSYQLDDIGGSALFEYFRREGIALSQADGGVIFARRYLGRMGGGKCSSSADRFLHDVLTIVNDG